MKHIIEQHAPGLSDDTIIVTSTVTIHLGVGSFNNACSALSHLLIEFNVGKGEEMLQNACGSRISST